MAGLEYSKLENLKGGDAVFNAKELMKLLKGEKNAYRDAVVLNASCALVMANLAKTIDALSNKYRVVAPDLRGLGLSERTSNGYDKKTIATGI